MKKIFSLLVLSSLLYACVGEDYLDGPKPTDSITEPLVFSSSNGVDAYISGIYRLLRSQYEGITDIGGLYSVYYTRSVKGNDLVVRSNWYMRDYDNNWREPTDRRTWGNWQFLYEVVFHANVLINGVINSEALTEEEKKVYVAHGKALRAMAYFELIVDYQQTYTYDKTLPAIPIYTQKTTAETESNPVSTIEEVYNLIKADLQEAIANLGDDRLDKSYMNARVANGFYARVLQVTQDDWGACATAANAAYGGDIASVLVPETYANGFDDLSNIEWLWGMQQQADQTNYYYLAPHAFLDHLTLSYQNSFVGESLVNLFSDTDVRKLFVENYYGAGAPAYMRYITTKFHFSFESEAPWMRTPEMILAEAEARHMLGDDTAAANLLFKLQKNRDPNAVASSNTGDALLDEIIVERRKELYGEYGTEFWDLKRLRRPMVRDTYHRTPVSLPADDVRYFLPIPEKEILNNANIDESINDGK